MAKPRHDDPPPAGSRNALIIMALGGIAVAALVVWALTRTVEPTPDIPTPVAATTETFTPSPTATTTPLPPSATTLNPTIAPPTGESTASVPRMAAEDVREKLRANEIVLVDVRDAAAYSTSHIPGALHIPFASVEGAMKSLPKGKPIVTYCT